MLEFCWNLVACLSSLLCLLVQPRVYCLVAMFAAKDCPSVSFGGMEFNCDDTESLARCTDTKGLAVGWHRPLEQLLAFLVTGRTFSFG